MVAASLVSLLIRGSIIINVWMRNQNNPWKIKQHKQMLETETLRVIIYKGQGDQEFS